MADDDDTGTTACPGRQADLQDQRDQHGAHAPAEPGPGDDPGAGGASQKVRRSPLQARLQLRPAPGDRRPGGSLPDPGGQYLRP